ncbi:MAG: CoA transferase [Chloroflexi bacterium]|nr:CoA transferase [Chloroflexota bacterium]
MWVRTSTFGPEGPYRQKVGFDGVAQAMSGNLHLTGYPDEPMKNLRPSSKVMSRPLARALRSLLW